MDEKSNEAADISNWQREADIFDDVLFIEETMIHEGRLRGEEDGRKQGFEDGKELGIGHGTQLGHEVGFYYGCLTAWLKLSNQLDGRVHGAHAHALADRFAKAQKMMQQLHEQIKEFSFLNAEDEKVLDKVMVIRAKFTLLTKRLGFSAAFATSRTIDKLNF